MARKLILHLGFHKTGSTSIQELLRVNRKQLAPFIHCIVHNDKSLRNIQKACRSFDKVPSHKNQNRLEQQWADVLKEASASQAEIVLISSEDLIGRIPSVRDEAPAYEHSPEIVAILLSLASDFETEIVLYKRDGVKWLDSLHRHLIQTRGIRNTRNEFETLPKFSNPDDLFNTTARRISSLVWRKVHLIDMESDLATRIGPGDGLLRIAGLSEDDLKKVMSVPPQNEGIDSFTANKIQANMPTWWPNFMRKMYVITRRLISEK